MKIKRYIGSNAQEAMLKVKMDLGVDSIILNTRKVRQKGIINFFKKPMVEVLAVADNSQSRQKKQETPNKREIPNNEEIVSLSNKVKDIEVLLHRIGQKLDIQDSSIYNPDINEQKYDISSKTLELFYDNMIINEVEEDIAKKIIEDTRNVLKDKSSVNETVSAIKGVIAKILGKPEAIKENSEKKPRIVTFVGPTGVGKTTTLAKIAANLALVKGSNIGLITADTYRIAAVEQLKTYAQILGIPVYVIYSPSELVDAINNYSDKDIILIDTAGIGYKDKTQLKELEDLIDASKADEVYLVLSMTMSKNCCKEVIKKYSFLKEYKLIFTKTDETPASGIILNTRSMTGKNLSYITTGQNVPEDIEIADIDMIIKNLLGSKN